MYTYKDIHIHVHVCLSPFRVTPHNVSGFTTSLSRFNVGEDWLVITFFHFIMYFTRQY